MRKVVGKKFGCWRCNKVDAKNTILSKASILKTSIYVVVPFI